MKITKAPASKIKITAADPWGEDLSPWALRWREAKAQDARLRAEAAAEYERKRMKRKQTPPPPPLGEEAERLRAKLGKAQKRNKARKWAKVYKVKIGPRKR